MMADGMLWCSRAGGCGDGYQTPWYSFLSAECRDQDAGNDPCDRCDAEGECRTRGVRIFGEL